MKIVLPGGRGHLGRILTRHFTQEGHEVVTLSRDPDGRADDSAARQASWDGQRLGSWAQELDGADVVINVAGRSVDCRYNKTNLEAMMSSRLDSTRVVGEAIAVASRPPALWLQMSTATIYAHRHDAPHTEKAGTIGGFEADVPSYWRYSILIAEAWERELMAACVPYTRRIALRSAMVMSPDPGGPLETLIRLTRCGLGGPIAGGSQYMSWIHHQDFVRAVEFLIGHEELEGAINLTAPESLPQREFSSALRSACGIPFGLPAARWMIMLGAVLLRTDPELILKSRRVAPGRLLEAGFEFSHPLWRAAAEDLTSA